MESEDHCDLSQVFQLLQMSVFSSIKQCSTQQPCRKNTVGLRQRSHTKAADLIALATAAVCAPVSRSARWLGYRVPRRPLCLFASPPQLASSTRTRVTCGSQDTVRTFHGEKSWVACIINSFLSDPSQPSQESLDLSGDPKGRRARQTSALLPARPQKQEQRL